jgi:hypothetical protein
MSMRMGVRGAGALAQSLPRALLPCAIVLFLRASGLEGRSFGLSVAAL